jgi:hypothetical protein
MKQPPVPPTVTMRDGLLTIDAPNSTLSEVLKGVRQATGAVLEGVSPTDRVAVRLGPGHPREVVAALLQGTPYDYLILGSERDAQAVTRILLTQSSSSSEPNMPRQPQMIQAPIPEPASEPAFVEPERPPEYFQPDQGVPPETVPEGDQAQPPTPPQPVSPERPMTAPPLPTPQP